MNSVYLAVAAACAVMATALGANAAEPPPDAAAEAPPEADVSFDASATFATAYVWRGWNMFHETKQNEQHMMLAPGANVSFPKAGLTIGYWSAYQLNGDNRKALVNAGVANEQDLILTYETPLSEDLTGTVGFTAYFYPFAKKSVAGTSVPTYVEPTVGITYATFADLSFAAFYYHGVQEEVKALRHVYLTPSVSKSFELSPSVGLEPKVAFGYKIFNDSDMKYNVYDALVAVGLPIDTGEALTITPSVNGAWTNLPGGFGDEYVVFGGLQIGFAP